ncbi:LysR family transcriptional regulator [Aestuariibius insulae]|uniref:helix-turn-helix domain-containing protein n=1 Tax=Aestuariibius insulae TaxID=2058287 RepID=UPI00345F139B
MARQQGEAILFELLRSFTMLAETLNLSRTVERLGTTRQTVRRHLVILEEHMGGPLFELVDREYQLTERGRNALREAEELLARGDAWLRNQSGHIDGRYFLRSNNATDQKYFLEQQPLRQLWTVDAPLLQESVRAWAEAKGELEHAVFAPIRPYIMVFRLHGEDWLCTHVGEKSSFATWFGWEWERSMIGRGLVDFPGGRGFARLMTQPFREVYETEGLRLDHILTHIPRDPDGPPAPIAYRRLLLGCRFPDSSFALVSVVDRTHNLKIEGVERSDIEAMPEDLVMSINPLEAA